eukprot:234427_1
MSSEIKETQLATTQETVNASDEKYNQNESSQSTNSNSKFQILKWCSTFYINHFGGIDSTSQTFNVNIHYVAVRQMSMEEKTKFKQNPDSFEPQYIFGIGVYGATGSDFMIEPFDYGKTWQIQQHSKLGLCIQHNYVIVQQFIENMELESFPFDVQHFQMTFAWDWYSIKTQINDDSIKFKFEPKFSDYQVRTGFFNLIGFEFKGIALSGYTYEADNELGGTEGELRSWNWYRVILRRSWTFYWNKVVFVLCIISLMSITVFLFGSNSLSDRLGFLSTTLLTAVAYIYIVNEYIPPLNYTTLLDKYLYFVIIFIFLITIQCCVIDIDAVEREEDDTFSTDRICLYVNTGLWAIIHLIFIITSIVFYTRESKKMEKTKDEIDGAYIFSLGRYAISYNRENGELKDGVQKYKNTLRRIKND